MSATLADDFPRRSLIEDLAAGSRATPPSSGSGCSDPGRGDNFARSDIDLAVEAPGMNRGDWLRIKVDFEDEPPTLLLVDLVRFEDAPAILREEILEGGIVV
jgi:hypothetical protein